MNASPSIWIPIRCSCDGAVAGLGTIAPGGIGVLLTIGPRTGSDGAVIQCAVGVEHGVSCATLAIGSSAASIDSKRADEAMTRADRRAVRPWFWPARTSVAMFRFSLPDTLVHRESYSTEGRWTNASFLSKSCSGTGREMRSHTQVLIRFPLIATEKRKCVPSATFRDRISGLSTGGGKGIPTPDDNRCHCGLS
jgi:hypothetical protein